MDETIGTAVRPEEVRALLVDDDPTVLHGYSRVLERHGVTVDTASNGKEAVERVKGGRFDVIVSDISMPGMDGLTLLRTVRERDFDVTDSQANFVWAAHSSLEGDELAARLSRGGVLIAGGAALGEPRHVRIGLRNAAASDRLLGAIDKALA